jgi:hypothetical protein
MSVAADTAVSLRLARLHHVTFYLSRLLDLHSSYPSRALCPSQHGRIPALVQT